MRASFKSTSHNSKQNNMSGTVSPSCIYPPPREKIGIGDFLLEPLTRCGRLWNHVGEMKESSFVQKTIQVLFRVLLVLPILITGALGTVGSLMKSCFVTGYKRDWGDGNAIEMPLDFSLQTRCREIGIDQKEAGEACAKILRNNWSQKSRSSFLNWPWDFLNKPITVYDVNVISENPPPGVFSKRTLTGIRFADTYDLVPHSRLSLLSNLFKDLCRCFQNQEKVSLEKLPHYLLGCSVSPGEQRELDEVIRSTDEIYLIVAKDLTLLRLLLARYSTEV
jgi:hypothetical protein